MSEQPIKLTDDALRSLLHGLGMHYPLGESKQIVDAIRALRDRARAVVDSREPDSVYRVSKKGEKVHLDHVERAALDALSEVL